MTDQEASRVDAVTVVDNALRGGLFSLSLEPHRHSELAHFVVGKPRTKKGYLKIIFKEIRFLGIDNSNNSSFAKYFVKIA